MRVFWSLHNCIAVNARVRFWVTGDAHFENPSLSHPAGSFGELGADPHQPWRARGGRPSMPC